MADRHLPLGPVLWGRVDSATALEDRVRTAWDQGVVSAAEAFDRPRSGFFLFQIVAAAVGAVFAGRVAGDGLLFEAITRVGLALLAFWFVPTAWAVVVTAKAPARQRNEARSGWRLEEARVNDLQERLERLTLMDREIEDHEIALSSLRESIERNRSSSVSAGNIEDVERAFTRIREMLGRYDTVRPPAPFDQVISTDISKAALTALVEDGRHALREVGKSIGLALRVLDEHR